MSVLFDGERLTRLISDLNALSGIRVSVLDAEGTVLCESGPHARFCEQAGSCGEGRRRCSRCASRALRECGSAVGTYFYRCHAGICMAVLPVHSGDQPAPLAYLCAGPFLIDLALEEQWAHTRDALAWFPGGTDALRHAFLRLRRCSTAERSAFAGMLEALADSIRLRTLIQSAGETNLQRLERYLDEHYMEKLSLASVSAQLHIGRTKLCALAKELSGGQTLFYMISQRRIQAAKALLLQSDAPISAIAEAVGISDYNYFSKIFRRAAGVSPSEFRRQARSGAGISV